jgi:coenzyme F420 hydrogenase subunit beta
MTARSAEPMHYRNICDIIVPSDMCIGCGLCVGVCPPTFNALKMEWNEYGEPIPVEVSGRCTDCGLCLPACPFWSQDDNETTLAQRAFGDLPGIQHHSVLGVYLDLFSGFSRMDGHRANGAAGGLTTWLLEKLLAERVVERVACVAPTGDPDALFRFRCVTSAEELRRCARSVYYPVDMHEVISEITRVEGKHAVVGLPCFVKGLRLAARKDARLRKRIIVLVSLVCGQTKSKFFAEYLTAKAGGQPSQLRRATFRVKDQSRHQLDHRFEFISGSDEHERKGHTYQSEGMGVVWGQDWFKFNACSFCDDIVGEVADVTFGDAVAQPYSYGNMGANFAIVRSPLILNMLLRGANAGEIVLDRVSVDAVVDRQRGVVLNKREDLAHRLHKIHAADNAAYIPTKRVSPKRRFDFLANIDMEMRDAIRVTSRSTYAKCRHQPNAVTQVDRAIEAVLGQRGHVFRFLYRLALSKKFHGRGFLFHPLYRAAVTVASRVFCWRPSRGFR